MRRYRHTLSVPRFTFHGRLFKPKRSGSAVAAETFYAGGFGRVLFEFETGRPAGLVYQWPSEAVYRMCLFSILSSATRSRTSHENLSGNCFTNAVVNVSAMT